MLKIGTIFSGGLAAVEFALKYENLDHRVVFACEKDKYARKQYLQFHDKPETFYEDVLILNGSKYKENIDLLAWGSPCQDVSIGGKRKGLTGEKSSLFFEGIKIMKAIKPKYFIFENVKGLLSSNRGEDYKQVISCFIDLGYYLHSKLLNTSDYGDIPQNRNRLYIVGFLNKNEYNNFSFESEKKTKKVFRDFISNDVDDVFSVGLSTRDKIKNKQLSKSQGSKIHDLDKLCPTLCAGSQGYSFGYIKTKTYRRLTPFEFFRLQGVKAIDIKLINSKTQSYKIAGNAMSVNVVQSILRSLFVNSK